METNTVSTVPSTNEDGEGFIGNINANEQQPNTSTPPSNKEVATSPPTPNNNNSNTDPFSKFLDEMGDTSDIEEDDNDGDDDGDKSVKEETSPPANTEVQPPPPPPEIGNNNMSAFSSPLLLQSENNIIDPSHILNQQLLMTVPLRPTLSSSSAGLNDSSHTPLLNGENIMLTFSNETTPTGLGGGNRSPQRSDQGGSTPLGVSPSGLHIVTEMAALEQSHHTLNEGESNNDTGNNNNNAEDVEMNISPLSAQLNSNANSPPPESIHSGKITTLSPPPLSKANSNGDEYADHRSHISGSQSLFSRDGGSISRGRFGSAEQLQQQQQQPQTVASAGGNTAQSKKKRPPLPPRWAIGGNGGGLNTGVASSHHAGMQPVSSGHVQSGGDMVDVVPSHLPPPKAIATSHRRVFSTGDASFLSNLTDPNMDSDGVGDDNSPPLAVAVPNVLLPTANNNSANNNKHLPKNPAAARKRGVSWDFIAPSHSESDSLNNNRYKDEEEAAFNTLGILQPVLPDEEDVNIGGGDGDNDMMIGDLMQPILLDDDVAEEEDIEAAVLESSAPDFLPPPPPPPPEKVVQKRHNPSKSGVSLLSTLKLNSSFTSRSGVSVTKPKKDHTEFEDEAEQAILNALAAHSMSAKPDDQMDSADQITDLEDDQDDDDNLESKEDDDDKKEGDESIPSQIVPKQHHKTISALTTANFEHDSSPKQHDRKSGDCIFEDSAWTSNYDAQGRIDGTLPEEQNTNQLPSVVAAAAATSSSPSLISRLTSGGKKTANDTSQETLTSKQMKKGDTSPRQDTPQKQSKLSDTIVKDPTTITGLRHRRSNTIAAKTMVEELAEIAALHSGEDFHESLHKRTDTAMKLQTKDKGGINNLLAGVNILAQHEEAASEADGKSPAHDTTNATNLEDIIEEDEPQDEEMGNANNSSEKDNPSQKRPSTLDKRSETMYRMKIWYHDLIEPKLPQFWKAAKHHICFIMMPLLIVAFILFYACGNPMTGSTVDKAAEGTEDAFTEDDWNTAVHASFSWWALFFCRQTFILACVKTGEVISIDILALRTPLFLKVIGSFATLMLVQARGWPYVLTFWSLSDFCVLYGNNPFSHHWLFWQDKLDIFNANNPPGLFLESEFYLRLLLAALLIGLLTSLKRLWLATSLGKRSYYHYGPELEVILAKMLMISQVSHLARQIESKVVTSRVGISDGYTNAMKRSSLIGIPGLGGSDSEDTMDQKGNTFSFDELDNGFGKSLRDIGIGSHTKKKSLSQRMLQSNNSKLFSSSAKMEIMQLLEEWEEPDIKTNSASKLKIKDVLQFRQAVAMMDDTYPFTPAFGQARTRGQCVESSEWLYETLKRAAPNSAGLLAFETLSEICYDSNGELIRDKVKAMIKVFRPDRKGYLNKLEFVSSIDNVYRDLRVFRASLANSSSIDDAYETIINTVYYILIVFLGLIILGFKLWQPLLSFSAFFISFSFMFGSASSKYFEGLLLIFVRRPYDIGDKISISDPEKDTSAEGSSTWFVEDVSVFTTTVRFATTNEVATYSNGSLARLRIINAKRSPKAVLYVYMKFAADVPYQMIKVYQTAIENFVKSRPREWAQLNGFRATRVEMELNYIEYVIVATHREMWQNIGPILQSKADLAAFSLEVSKKLGLRYHNPPKPIVLSINEEKDQPDHTAGVSELQQVAQMFGKGGTKSKASR